MFKQVNGKKVKLTDAEMEIYNARQQKWEDERPQREAAEKLEAIRLDPNMPTIEEKVDALLDGNQQKINEIKSRIQAVKLAHGGV